MDGGRVSSKVSSGSVSRVGRVGPRTELAPVVLGHVDAVVLGGRADVRERLVALYGADRGKAVKYAEAFELCEYGRQAPADELKKMFVP